MGTECDLHDPVVIGLISVTVFNIIIILFLIFYIFTIKSKCKCRRTSSTSESNETLIKAHRTSIPNRYEVDGYDFQHNKLHRARSAPIRPVKSTRMSEYDSITCSPVTHNPPSHPGSSNNNMIENGYEEVQKPSEPYGSIINHVVDSLASIYSNKENHTDIQEKFLRHLMNAMKAKNVKLLESRKNSVLVEKHQYEEIDESKHRQKTQVEYDSDSSYAVYVGQKRKSDEKNDGLMKMKEFGSTDHLKYLKKNKSLSNLVEKDPDYLKPYEFSAKNDCPEELKKLCKNQDSAYNTMDKNETTGLEYQITDLAAKFYPNRETKIKLPRDRTLSERPGMGTKNLTKPLEKKKSYSTSHKDIYF